MGKDIKYKPVITEGSVRRGGLIPVSEEPRPDWNPEADSPSPKINIGSMNLFAILELDGDINVSTISYSEEESWEKYGRKFGGFAIFQYIEQQKRAGVKSIEIVMSSKHPFTGITN